MATGGRQRVLVLLGVAAALGGADVTLWAAGGGAVFWVANMSCIYLALAFVAGGLAIAVHEASSWVPAAAMMGAAAPLVALGAFYVELIFRKVMSATFAEHALLRYGLGALVVGPAFGIVGAVWAKSRARWSLALLGGAMLLEPVAWRAHLGFLPRPFWQWMAEAAVGVTLALIACVLGRSRSSSAV